jgi:sterol desaturase/sphingolipid hydroxylase (fatty acid hydroxylase superfamily)
MEFETAKRIIAAIFVGFVLLEWRAGLFLFRKLSSRKDTLLDTASTLLIPGILVPSILYLSSSLTEILVPGSEDQWAHWPAWAMVGVLLLADDLTQYAWHRLSHTSWLYPLHRAHHSAAYLSVRVVYRNNLIYYALMPGLWLSGMLIHWGFMAVYPVYGIIKMTVIIGAHSSVPWDAALHRWSATRPLIWILERVISTPTTHSAHHGLHESDGVTHYRGNYGNLLFFWDILFGTARIAEKRPQEYGIEGLKPVSWKAELLWPTREESESLPK